MINKKSESIKLLESIQKNLNEDNANDEGLTQEEINQIKSSLNDNFYKVFSLEYNDGELAIILDDEGYKDNIGWIMRDKNKMPAAFIRATSCLPHRSITGNTWQEVTQWINELVDEHVDANLPSAKEFEQYLSEEADYDYYTDETLYDLVAVYDKNKKILFSKKFEVDEAGVPYLLQFDEVKEAISFAENNANAEVAILWDGVRDGESYDIEIWNKTEGDISDSPEDEEADYDYYTDETKKLLESIQKNLKEYSTEDEIVQLHNNIEDAESVEEIQDLIHIIEDTALEHEVQLAYDQSIRDRDSLDELKSNVITTLEDNAEYNESSLKESKMLEDNSYVRYKVSFFVDTDSMSSIEIEEKLNELLKGSGLASADETIDVEKVEDLEEDIN